MRKQGGFMSKEKRARFYSNNLKEWVEGIVVKENDKTVWLEIPNSYKVVVNDIPLSDLKINKILGSTGINMPNFSYKTRELDKGVPTIIKKKKRYVEFINDGKEK